MKTIMKCILSGFCSYGYKTFVSETLTFDNQFLTELNSLRYGVHSKDTNKQDESVSSAGGVM